MFEPALLDLADGRLAEARDRAAAALDSGIATLTPRQTSADRITAARAAWSLVHGFVSLWTTGRLLIHAMAPIRCASRRRSLTRCFPRLVSPERLSLLEL